VRSFEQVVTFPPSAENWAGAACAVLRRRSSAATLSVFRRSAP